MHESKELGSITSGRRSLGAHLSSGVLLLAGLPAVGHAQTQFEERLPKRYLPSLPEPASSLAMADLDGDGDEDVVVGHTNGGRERLLLNDGAGTFLDATATHLPAPPSSFLGKVALGDLDGDGDLDLVLPRYAPSTAPSRVYLNDGTAHFVDDTVARMPSSVNEANGAVFGDIDRDGDQDLLLYRSDLFKQTLVLLNDGLGFFTDVTATNMPVSFSYGQTVDAALGDVDGDGDLDLVKAKYFSGEQLYLNDGAGVFTGPQFGRLPSNNNIPWSVVLVDVDADLDLDIVVANAHSQQTDLLFVNDGEGTFSDASSRLPPVLDDTRSVAVGDVDGDSDPDIAFGNVGQSRLALNDGTGTFVGAPLPAVGYQYAYAAGLAELDGDGDLDLLLGDYLQDRVYWNDGAGGFTNATPERIVWGLSVESSALAVADVDLDGDADILAANGEYLSSQGGAPDTLYLNDGTGAFEPAAGLGPGALAVNSVALATGDVDGDADPDVLLGNATVCGLGYGGFQCDTRTNRLYFNDGQGTFTEQTGRLPPDANDTFAVALEDLDGDADLDIVAGNWTQQSRLYRNNGSGEFSDVTAGRFPVRSDKTRALALGDVDGDTDLDLAVGNEGQQDRLYLNEGLGAFGDLTATRMPPDSRETRALGMGDVDRDGDLDLVLGRDGQTGLYSNDGLGFFSDVSSRIPAQTEEAWALQLADVDEDGDLDALLGNRTPTGGEAVARLYVNDGTGSFTDATAARLPADLVFSQAVLLADLDGDRDLDWIAGNDFSPSSPWRANRVYLNLHRQVAARVLPILGRTYEIELESRPGYASGPRTAAVAFGLALRPSPLVTSYGALYLQSPLSFLPTTTIPSPAGSTVVSIAVPTDTALVGLTFFAQAAILGGGPELTGYLRDTFAK